MVEAAGSADAAPAPKKRKKSNKKDSTGGGELAKSAGATFSEAVKDASDSKDNESELDASLALGNISGKL